jgi:hypothetical protein
MIPMPASRQGEIAMGVYVDYSFYAECHEAEMVARLRRLRQKVARLPLARVGRIKRLDPVYQGMPLQLLREQGYRLPAMVRARLKGKASRAYRLLCGLAAPVASMLVPQELERRFLEPALEFIKTTALWNEADLPKQVECGSITIFRPGFALALADVMLRHGYLMILDPGEGSETVHVGLTTLRRQGVPLWLGSGFTKTQYATHFIQAHENVCHILDAAQEVGLLYQARDTCGFYKHRSWKKAAPIVNEETTFAHVVGQMLSAGVAAAQAAGMRIEDISDPATKNFNLIHVDGEPEPEGGPAAGRGR